MATYEEQQLDRTQNSQYAPADQFPNPQQPQTTTQQQQSSGGNLQDILSRYTYGAAGLGQAEGELNAAGYQLQKDSAGRVRGRLKAANGDIIDVIGQGEGNDWWNNQTGTSWNINNRGQEGLDAGGWSFGGPSQSGSTGSSQSLANMQGLDPQIQELMRANPGWSAADAQAWAARYYTPAAGGANPSTPGTPTPAEGGAENRDSFMQLLSERMRQGTDIDANDPVIKNQVDNFRASQERDRRTHQNEIAEMAAARGLADSGAQTVENRMSNERAAQATSGFQSELIGRELVARRDEIRHAIDTFGAQLTEQERQALQRELAEADNAVRRYGIDTQNSQYFAGLSQADRHFAQQLAQSGRFADMDNAYRYAQLGQQGQQFADQMGFNIGDRQAYWDAVRRGQL